MAINFIYFVIIAGNVGLIGWLLYLVFNKKDEIKGDILINFDSKRTHGRFLGFIKKLEYGARGRREILFEPRDVDPNNIKDKIEDESIITLNHLHTVFPKHTLSDDCAINVILPHRPEHLSDFVKKTQLGVALKFVMETEDFVSKNEEILKSKIKNRDDLLKEIGDGEYSKEYIAKMKNYTMDLLEMVLKAKGEKKTDDFLHTKTDAK